MHRISRIVLISVVLALCATHVTSAQDNPKGAAKPAAKQNTFGLGSGGRPTPPVSIKSVSRCFIPAIKTDSLYAEHFELHEMHLNVPLP